MSNTRGVLTLGASTLEAEPIGQYQVQQRTNGAISVTVTFEPQNLVKELLQGGVMPELKPKWTDQEGRKKWRRQAEARVAAFGARAGEHLRIWVTTTLAWDDQVRRMDEKAFLGWLAEFPPDASGAKDGQ